jgi:hypothetical protein
MKKVIFCAAIAATVLATGCSKEEGTQTTNNDANAIEFRGVVDKATRATAVVTDEFTSFFVHGGVHATAAAPTDLTFLEASVYKDGSAWTYAPMKYYPTDGKEVDFYAYAPVKDVNMTADVAVVSGKVQFDYTVPVDQKVDNKAVDLLVASVVNQKAPVPPAVAAPVAFSFNHALSAVSFSAANRNAITGAGSELTYVINDISVTALDNEGTFAYPIAVSPATSWTPVGDQNQTYIAGLPEAGVALEAIGLAPAAAQKLLSANDLMMVLPQAVTPGTLDVDGVTPLNDGTYVAVTYSLKDGAGVPIFTDAVRYLTLPSNFTFEAGKRYNFEFEFGGASNPMTAISFTVTEVVAWADAPNTVIPQ